MKDFTKWVEAWNTYIHPPTKQVPRTAAELSTGEHSAWVIIAIMCIFTLAAIILHCLEERSTLFVVLSGVFTGLGIFIVFLGTVAVLMLIQPTKTVDENVPRPASFVTQVGREFGVRNLSCPAKVMTASELPDMGSYHCVYTYGANDANLRNVTLVVADGNKVGLYKADGKALKPVGKD